MPIETMIDPTDDVVLHTVTGRLTMDAIRSAFAAVIEHPRARKNIPAIWDLRNADASQTSADEILQIIEFFQAHLDKRSGHRVAIVAGNDLSFGLSRMYEIQAQNLKAEIQVFRNFDNARKWAVT